MTLLIALALGFMIAQGGSPPDPEKQREQQKHPLQRLQEEQMRLLEQELKQAQSPEQRSQLIEQFKERLRLQLQSPQPDVESENWRELTPDLGVWLYRDEQNVLRGRMFVQYGGAWMPIAVEGLEELGPYALPAE
jgi:hypothetical protein